MATYTPEELATMSYYNDSVFGERLHSALHDFRFIPFFNPSIPNSVFAPRLLRLAAAASARFADERGFSIPANASLWELVAALQKLADELKEEHEAQQAARYAEKQRR